MPDFIQEFTEMFESLAGHVHVVSGEAALTACVAGIVREAGAQRVALGDVPEGLRAQLIASGDVEIVAPPYQRDALPGAIDGAQVGVGGIAYAIAQTGTLVEETTDDALRLVSAKL